MNCPCGTEIVPDANYCHKCGRLYVSEMPEDILYHGVCPRCHGYKKPRVIETLNPNRIIKCQECGFRFKTIEIVAVGPKFMERAAKMVEFLKKSHIY